VYFLSLRMDGVGRSCVSALCHRSLCGEILTADHIVAESTEGRVVVGCMERIARACRLVLDAVRGLRDGEESRGVEGQAVWKGDGSQANGKGNRPAMVPQQPGY
jgi:hypothetical protein